MTWEKMRTTVILFVVILITIGGFLYLYDFKSNTFRIKLGLDLRSGTHILLELVPVEEPGTGSVREITPEIVKQTKRIFERRLNPKGVTEIIIQEVGKNRISIDIPEETDVEKAEKLIKKTARLEFREMKYDPVTKEETWITVMDGSHLTRAIVDFSNGGAPEVSFELDKVGAKQFAEITERLIDKPLGIFFDKEKISAPKVQTAIPNGSGRITGMESTEACQELATYLNAGALPVDVKILESSTVSPTLGKESLNKSLAAGLIGLLIVCIFMIGYYRLPGVIADIALVIYSVICLSSMVLFGFVLTLPGIAGFILSIGMAVDANILIFERLKEELWEEKSLRSAIDLGFKRAFSSILDSHVTIFLTAAILYELGSSSIKGFGLTLMIGTFWSLITATFGTRIFIDWLMEKKIVVSRKIYGE
ncbi:MAG: protein translocase subunit SecD [Chloroflexi bacterium]|nr:protein translocase subunit SecD [Chloroflexota bacterium]